MDLAIESKDVLDIVWTWEIAEIEARASPLNPFVFKLNMSSDNLIFDVACL